MIVCDFCLQYQEDGKCGFGLNIPKQMSCREYNPGLEKFCSDPKDFVSADQLIQMASYFGMKGGELKKVKLMALREEERLKVALTQAQAPLRGYEAGEA
ncbi:MAG TPA: hypothetical protein VJQ56_01505 [Blastocatellia bacterium]|nr:hypothetical protein [Blastocatellia bacterium]